MSESDRQVQISLPPQVVERPRSYFAFAQQRGPTTEAAKHCWVEVFAKLVPFLESLEGGNPATCTFSQYRLGDDPVYRAGVGLRSPLTGPLPEGILCEEVCGGQFAQFSCTGPYERLGDAREQVARLAVELALAVRPDEFSVQQFVPQPGAVPADEAVTDLLVPIE
eukprot:gene14913-17473_t